MANQVVTYKVQFYPETDPEEDEDAYSAELAEIEARLEMAGATNIDLDWEDDV
jgi:hypothetical protein